jgi:hypothetical protein
MNTELLCETQFHTLQPTDTKLRRLGHLNQRKKIKQTGTSLQHKEYSYKNYFLKQD